MGNRDEELVQYAIADQMVDMKVDVWRTVFDFMGRAHNIEVESGGDRNFIFRTSSSFCSRLVTAHVLNHRPTNDGYVYTLSDATRDLAEKLDRPDLIRHMINAANEVINRSKGSREQG